MKAIIIFDGVCGFCNAYVQFVLRHDPDASFRFVSSQSKAGAELLAGHSVSLDSIVLVEAGVIYTKSDAILRICRQLSGLWSWLWLFRYVPRFLRDMLYDLFARHRYVFGRKTVCQIPTSAERQRIILS